MFVHFRPPCVDSLFCKFVFLSFLLLRVGQPLCKLCYIYINFINVSFTLRAESRGEVENIVIFSVVWMTKCWGCGCYYTMRRKMKTIFAFSATKSGILGHNSPKKAGEILEGRIVCHAGPRTGQSSNISCGVTDSWTICRRTHQSWCEPNQTGEVCESTATRTAWHQSPQTPNKPPESAAAGNEHEG